VTAARAQATLEAPTFMSITAVDRTDMF
jgi:hypothetical protein